MSKIFYILLFVSCQLAHAANAFLYQVDMIFFVHDEQVQTRGFFVTPTHKDAILLKSGSDELPYQLLEPSESTLKNEYKILSEKMHDNILINYSWLQPEENNNKVLLPDFNNDKWKLSGTIKVVQKNYYTLETDFILADDTDNQISIKHKRRLKPEVVYYLDHPHAGLIIKIHQII